jgi:hypothetical protein
MTIPPPIPRSPDRKPMAEPEQKRKMKKAKGIYTPDSKMREKPMKNFCPTPCKKTLLRT